MLGDDSLDEQLDADSAENDLMEELNKLVLEDKKNSKRKVRSAIVATFT